MTHDQQPAMNPRQSSGPEFEAMLARARVTVLDAAAERQRRRWWAFVAAGFVLFGLGATTGAAVAGGTVDADVLVGPTAITVPAPERESSLLRVTFTCLDEGTYIVSVADAPNGTLEGTCDGTGRSSSSFDFMIPTSLTEQLVDVRMTAGARYALQTEYRGFIGAGYPTNAAGQTFGRPEPGALNVPDLMLVIGKDNSNASVRGYVETAQLEPPAGLIGAPLAKWTADFRTQYPSGKPLPLYDSDGTTVLGTYQLTW